MKRFQDYLIQTLKDPDEAAAYLNAALEDGDERIFLIALRDVVEAQSGMLHLSRKIKMSRANLYKMLSKTGHPEIQSLAKVLGAFGLSLSVSVKENSKKQTDYRKAA